MEPADANVPLPAQPNRRQLERENAQNADNNEPMDIATLIRAGRHFLERMMRQVDLRLFNRFVDDRDSTFFRVQAELIGIQLPEGASHRITAMTLLEALTERLDVPNPVERVATLNILRRTLAFLMPYMQEARFNRTVRAAVPALREYAERGRNRRLARRWVAAPPRPAAPPAEADRAAADDPPVELGAIDEPGPSQAIKRRKSGSSIVQDKRFCYNSFSDIFKSLDSQRLSGQFCDFHLIANDTELPVHKSILSASSPVFAAMLQHDCIESQEGKVLIKDVEGWIMKLVLDFIYKGECELNDDNFTQVYMAAEKYQLENLREYCQHYLMTRLSPETVLQVLQISKSLNLKITKSVAYYAARRFDQISQEDLNAADQEIVREIILVIPSSNVESPTQNRRKFQETVFSRLVKWVEQDREERGRYELELLGCVDFSLLSKEFFSENISKVKSFSTLPKAAKNMVKMLYNHYSGCFCPDCNGGGVALPKDLRCTRCNKKLFRATGYCGHQTSSQYPLYECCYASLDANPIGRQISHVVVRNPETITCEACCQSNVTEPVAPVAGAAPILDMGDEGEEV